MSKEETPQIDLEDDQPEVVSRDVFMRRFHRLVRFQPDVVLSIVEVLIDRLLEAGVLEGETFDIIREGVKRWQA